MYTDINITKFFQGGLDNPVAPQSQAFSSKNGKANKKIQSYVSAEWERRHFIKEDS